MSAFAAFLCQPVNLLEGHFSDEEQVQMYATVQNLTPEAARIPAVEKPLSASEDDEAIMEEWSAIGMHGRVEDEGN